MQKLRDAIRLEQRLVAHNSNPQRTLQRHKPPAPHWLWLWRGVLMWRVLGALMSVTLLLFLLNSYLVYWRGWPEFLQPLASLLWGTSAPSSVPLQSWFQWFGYAVLWLAAPLLIFATSHRSLHADAALYAKLAAYVVRAAYWAVLLIGLCDMLISFLRVEDFLEVWTGKYLATQLGRPTFRGTYVHYPLLVTALLIACFSRSIGFIWLTILVVLAEFQIVVSRFIFSYEQAFMGDLVRFWYAALFLFASAYTLTNEGHVRVDVLYANFSVRGKALANMAGAVLLGLPLCWTILLQGMAGKSSSISSPLLGFEISQSGYGMYVKYLMAGFLLVFAVSMTLQFVSTFLKNAAELKTKPPHAT